MFILLPIQKLWQTPAAASDRYLISEYAGADIALATITEEGFITKNDKSSY